MAADVFLSTPSARRATKILVTPPFVMVNFYPRPPRGGRLCDLQCGRGSCVYFYPRPPRGGRRWCLPSSEAPCYFYPRPPRGGRRACNGQLTLLDTFLSTPSARRATLRGQCRFAAISDFYPRPPRGGRPAGLLGQRRHRHISIHALREEGDWQKSFSKPAATAFLSTPSARRATPHGAVCTGQWEISIHALREEGDILLFHAESVHLAFLSTPSARRATCRPSGSVMSAGYFYPRPPRGGRPANATARDLTDGISIHALREEGDHFAHAAACGQVNFYPRPPRGGRLKLS